MRRALSIALVACAAALVPAASAAGADSFVDLDTGDDVNQGSGCPQPNPCATIGSGIEGAGIGDTVRVDDSATAYGANNVSLFGGKSVIADDWQSGDHLGRPIVQNTGAITAIAVNGVDSAGTIEGLTIRPNGADGLRLTGAVDAVRDNVFEDPGADGNEFGIRNGGSSPTIEDNTFTDLNIAVVVTNGSPRIEANDISGVRAASLTGAGVLAQGGSPTIVANQIHDPAAGTTAGIRTVDPVGAVELARNAVSEHTIGVRFADTEAAVTLNGDSITDATGTGLRIDDNDDDGDAAVTATNVTVVAAGAATEDIVVSGAPLTLDSSIVGDLGITAEDPGSDPASCAISFSRGPTAVSGGTGCSNFQTTDAPAFVGGGDFHLVAGSPMIDRGNPAAPAGGTLDIDGDPRALDGDGDGIPRRDIGADETPALADTVPPDTSIVGGPASGSTTSDSTPTFGLSSNEPAVSFQCRVDGGAFASCTSPRTIGPLGDGQHTFQARAKDAAGNLDASPAGRTFAIDTTQPPGGEPSNEFEIGGLKGKKLTLEVPGPGEIALTDKADQNARKPAVAAARKGLKPSGATATAAGDVTVKLRLTSTAKKKLKRKRKVKVKAAITYTPSGGSAGTQTAKLKVKKK